MFYLQIAIGMADTMKAAQYEPGGPEKLGVGSVPIPLIKDHQVLIKVFASAINRADTLQVRPVYIYNNFYLERGPKRF